MIQYQICLFGLLSVAFVICVVGLYSAAWRQHILMTLTLFTQLESIVFCSVDFSLEKCNIDGSVDLRSRINDNYNNKSSRVNIP